MTPVPFAPALATPAADLAASLAGPAAALTASIATPASPALAADSPAALAPTPSDTPNRFPLLSVVVLHHTFPVLHERDPSILPVYDLDRSFLGSIHRIR